MAHSSGLSRKMIELLTLSRENFYTEHQYLPDQDLSRQWRNEAQQIAVKCGLTAEIPEQYLGKPAKTALSSSMSRSQTHPPSSHRSSLSLQRTRSARANNLKRTSPSPVHALSSQEPISALPSKKRRTDTVHRNSMPALLEQQTIHEFEPFQFADYLQSSNWEQLGSNSSPQTSAIFTAPNYADPVLPNEAPITYEYDILKQSDSTQSSPNFSTTMSRQSSGISYSVTDAIEMLRLQSKQGINQTVQALDSYSSSYPETFPTYNTHKTFPQHDLTQSTSPLQRPTAIEYISSATPNLTEQKVNMVAKPNVYARQDAVPIAPKIAAVLVQPGYPTKISINGKEKCQIPRSTKPQPQAIKVYCSKCNERPDGYRGEHELRRHTERAHPKKTKKVWVCVNPSQDQSVLTGCKACAAGKTYNAYYNAAAHLRRVHFFPKQAGVDTGPRGGSGGGDQPPMDHLKTFWMREIDLPIGKTSVTDEECQKPDGPHNNKHTVKCYDPSVPMGQMVTSDDQNLFTEDFVAPRNSLIQANETFSFFPSSFNFADHSFEACNVTTAQASMVFV